MQWWAPTYRAVARAGQQVPLLGGPAQAVHGLGVSAQHERALVGRLGRCRAVHLHGTGQRLAPRRALALHQPVHAHHPVLTAAAPTQPAKVRAVEPRMGLISGSKPHLEAAGNLRRVVGDARADEVVVGVGHRGHEHRRVRGVSRAGGLGRVEELVDA